jgi:DNA invertase Pin-like site-specific DNA recombinase
MKDAIGYLRVSTQEQGRSGLSLAAQRFDIENFGKREGFSVTGWHQDIQTGAGKDPLVLRPGLAAALQEAHAAGCPLIVSRLDRLSRNVHFIAGLMEFNVHFAVAAFGQDVDSFTLHIYASIAQQERKMIGERISAAHAIAKRRGVKFGLQLRSRAERLQVAALGKAAKIQAALERARAYRMYIEWALQQPGINGRRISFTAAANKLNDRNVASPMGRRWGGSQMQRMAERLGINHPLAYIPDRIAKPRIRALFAANPYITAREVVAELRKNSPYRIYIYRAFAFLKEIRRQAADRSPVHKKVGWFIDDRTVIRIRIGEAWKKHPEYTGKQMCETLRAVLPEYVTVNWTLKVMHECWYAYATSRQRRAGVGRCALNPWRNHPVPYKSNYHFTAKELAVMSRSPNQRVTATARGRARRAARDC